MVHVRKHGAPRMYRRLCEGRVYQNLNVKTKPHEYGRTGDEIVVHRTPTTNKGWCSINAKSRDDVVEKTSRALLQKECTR